MNRVAKLTAFAVLSTIVGLFFPVNAGQVFVSKNAGQSWEAFDSEVETIALNPRGTLLSMVRKDGTSVYRGIESTGNWQEMAGPPGKSLKEMVKGPGSTFYGLATDDTIWFAPDRGKPWQQVNGALATISLGLDDSLWGVNSKGDIWGTSDNGKTWQKAQLPRGSQSWRDVAAIGPKGRLVLAAIAADHSIWTSGDKGKNWQKAQGALVQIEGNRFNHLWGVNAAGQIWTSTDTGKSWTMLKAPAPGVVEIAAAKDGVLFSLVSAEPAAQPTVATTAQPQPTPKSTLPVAQAAATIDPFQPEAGPLTLMNCSGQSISVNTFNNNDNGMLIPARKISVPANRTSGLSCRTSTCKLAIGSLKTGALSGPHVYVGGQVRATNKAAMSKGCDAYPATTLASAPPSATPGTPTGQNAPVVKEVTFENNGGVNITVKSKEGQTPVITQRIIKGNREKIPARLGDVFEVEFEPINGVTYSYPTIFIVDLDASISIVGNPPLAQLGKSALLELTDYSANYYGYDVAELNISNMASSLKPYKIFEEFSVTNTTAYSTGTGNVPMKAGFTISTNNRGAGDKDTHMSYGYSAFAKQWGASVSGTGPIGKTGAQGSLGIDFKSVEEEEKSEENIFIYSREQKTKFDILVDPRTATLDPDFRREVRSVKTAADAEKLIDKYGTHFNTKITYGGDKWYYAAISRERYSQFKSYGVSVKGKVSTSPTKQETKQNTATGSTTTHGSKGKEIGGEGALTYDEARSQGKQVEDIAMTYRALGGDGDFENWDVSEGNAMPVGFESERLDQLIDIRIFKDWSDPAQLKKAQALIKAAIDGRMKKLARLGPPAPAPKVYKVKLDRMEVTEEIDDSNKNTRGWVQVQVSPVSSNPSPKVVEEVALINEGPRYLYEKRGWSTEFSYIKGRTASGQQPVYVTVHPVLVSGQWKYPDIKISVTSTIDEKDDLINGYQAHRGGSGDIVLSTISAGRPKAFDFTMNAFATHAAKGSIRLQGNVSLELNEFSALQKGPLF